MPTPKTKKLIVITGNVGVTDTIVVHNATQKWRKLVKLDSNGECIYNPADNDYASVDGDKIYAYVNGKMIGNASGTMSAGGIKITLTGTADTKSAVVNL